MKKAKPWQGILAVTCWLFLWQLASMQISQEMLLASPVSVVLRLWELVRTDSFWRAAAFSLSRVAWGFLVSFAVGIALAVLAFRLRVAEIFLSPFMAVVKAAPVASYIILCLLFMSSRNLSAFCSFLMALPIMYTNILGGLQSTDAKLLEMAAVFQVGARRRIVYIYFSQLMPFLLSACSLSLGLCWKAGIAAEVIGLPHGSIGERLYQAKIFLDSKSLLSWTAVVVAISFLLEKAFLSLLKRLLSALEHR